MFNVPRWHHHHSSKLLINKAKSVQGNSLILESNAVRVTIQRDVQNKGWQIDYEIKHPSNSWSTGRVCMMSEDLRTAFKLSDDCAAAWGQTILDEHGGSVAHQGKYIRFGRYLNIPGPGTGHDGDPNVSIYLDDEVIAAVGRFFQ